MEKLKRNTLKTLFALLVSSMAKVSYSNGNPYRDRFQSYRQTFRIEPNPIETERIINNILGGKKIFISRKVNCLSCHEAPIIEEKFQGNFGPPLGGVGSRYDKEELRLRVIDSKLINPDSIMPSYFKKIKFERTPREFLNKTILSAQEVEDLVEYLYSLK